MKKTLSYNGRNDICIISFNLFLVSCKICYQVKAVTIGYKFFYGIKS